MHVSAAILLLLAGLVNIVAGFYLPLASCGGLDSFAAGGGGSGGGMGDPYGADPYGVPGGGDDFGMGPSGDGLGAPVGAATGSAPDPYDGNDPGAANALGFDSSEGVGASAPPPGAIAAEEKKTFGMPPAGMPPLNGYGQPNAEANPALVAGAQFGGRTAGTSEVGFDPVTGNWNTVFTPGPAPTIPQQAFLPQATVPIGFDAYGRAILGPQSVQAWPAMPPQTQTLESDSAKEAKKAAKKAARKEYRQKKEADREAKRKAEREERRKIEHRAHRREEEHDRAIRKQEERLQNAARAVAAEDAQERAAVEQAEEDARRRQSAQIMKERRAQAIHDARRQAMEREKAYRAEEAVLWEQQQRAEAQSRALAAAQNAAETGAPLFKERDSYLSQASTVPNGASRSNTPIFEHYDSDSRRSSGVPVPPMPQAYMPRQQRQSRHPDFLTDAVPLAPLPGQRSHLSSVFSIMSARPPRPAPPTNARTPVSLEQKTYFPDDEVEQLPASARRPESDAMSEKELLWTRMQEERERVLAQQALERGSATWRID